MNGRSPLKQSSDRPQTLSKRVSDDSLHAILQNRKTKNNYQTNREKKNFDVEKLNVGNRLKRVLAKFGGRTSYV